MPVLQTYREVEIYVSEDGKFVAEIEEQKISRSTLAAIKKAIDGTKGARRAFFSGRFDNEPEEDFVIQFESDGRIRTRSGIRKSWRGSPYVWDEELVAALKDLHARAEKAEEGFSREYQKLMRKAKPVTRALLGQKPDRGSF